MGASPASARACMRDAPIHNLHLRRARTSPFQPPLRMCCSGPSCLRQCCACLRLFFRLQFACLRTPSEDAVPDGIPCRMGYRAGWATVPRGMPCRMGYRAGWDTVPDGIPCRMGYRADWDTVPTGIPCRMGYRAARDTVPRGIPCRMGYRAARDTVPTGLPCRMGQSGPSSSASAHVTKRGFQSLCARVRAAATAAALPCALCSAMDGQTHNVQRA